MRGDVVVGGTRRGRPRSAWCRERWRRPGCPKARARRRAWWSEWSAPPWPPRRPSCGARAGWSLPVDEQDDPRLALLEQDTRASARAQRAASTRFWSSRLAPVGAVHLDEGLEAPAPGQHPDVVDAHVQPAERPRPCRRPCASGLSSSSRADRGDGDGRSPGVAQLARHGLGAPRVEVVDRHVRPRRWNQRATSLPMPASAPVRAPPCPSGRSSPPSAARSRAHEGRLLAEVRSSWT